MIFQKIVGCGNDFIVIDARKSLPQVNVPALCARKFGVGADGVILLRNSTKCDYQMTIYNADGSEAEMCGNGIRCLGLFLKNLGETKAQLTIETKAGPYPIEIDGKTVSVNMGPPKDVEWEIDLEGETLHYLDTGVPHLVIETDQIENFPLETKGPFFRNHPRFLPRGANITVVERGLHAFPFRTYERGIEGETFACGTGATAAAYVLKKKHRLTGPCQMVTKNGDVIEVSFSGDDLIMKGEATHVYSGNLYDDHIV